MLSGGNRQSAINNQQSAFSAFTFQIVNNGGDDGT
jgi:hypothetical protein